MAYEIGQPTIPGWTSTPAYSFWFSERPFSFTRKACMERAAEKYSPIDISDNWTKSGDIQLWSDRGNVGIYRNKTSWEERDRGENKEKEMSPAHVWAQEVRWKVSKHGCKGDRFYERYEEKTDSVLGNVGLDRVCTTSCPTTQGMKVNTEVRHRNLPSIRSDRECWRLVVAINKPKERVSH